MTPLQHGLLKELIAVNGGDAIFRPSSADRLIGCPGSIVLCARLPKRDRRSTNAQLEGSAAHKVAEDALTGVRQPDEWTDRRVVLSPTESWFVDQEMVESVCLYMSEVAAREDPGHAEKYFEHKLSLSAVDPSDPLLAENRGTGDCVIVNHRLRKISVIDLKHDKGVMVPGDSPQLKNYALMALVSFGVNGGWQEVETVVVQPRAFREAERVKPVSFAPMDLIDGFLGEIVGAMEEALDLGARLAVGKWCVFCKAQDVCPAYTDKALNLARDAFAAAPLFDASSAALVAPIPLVGTVDVPRPQVTAGTAVLPAAIALDPGDVATLLDRFDVYDAFKKAVQQRAAQMIQAGLTVPGWAIEARSGNRRFVEPAEMPPAFAALGATGKDLPSLLRAAGAKTSDMFTDPTLKSPARIEKLLPKERRGLVELLVERPLGEPTLVRSTALKVSTTTHEAGRLGPIAEEVPGT